MNSNWDVAMAEADERWEMEHPSTQPLLEGGDYWDDFVVNQTPPMSPNFRPISPPGAPVKETPPAKDFTKLRLGKTTETWEPIPVSRWLGWSTNERGEEVLQNASIDMLPTWKQLKLKRDATRLLKKMESEAREMLHFEFSVAMIMLNAEQVKIKNLKRLYDNEEHKKESMNKRVKREYTRYLL